MMRGAGGGMMGMQPSIILLKEGTDTSQGKAQLISNINACAAVADIVRTTLGPRGMDKLIHNNGKVMQPQPIIACLQVFSSNRVHRLHISMIPG